ncbi:MAG: hypothetical protein MJ252_02675 [archaeon]|nr:hypothetical protein [archaeon]
MEEPKEEIKEENSIFKICSVDAIFQPLITELSLNCKNKFNGLEENYERNDYLNIINHSSHFIDSSDYEIQ